PALARRALRHRRRAGAAESGGALPGSHRRGAGPPGARDQPVGGLERAGRPRPRHHPRRAQRRTGRRGRSTERRRRDRLLSGPPGHRLMQELGVDRLIALVAFGGTYLGLALGRLPFFRVDRTGVAIIGGAVVVVSGLLPWDRAVAAVDAHTLVLLFGMMIVAAYLRLSGFFRLVTYAAVRRAHTPVGLLALIIVAAGVLSALFVNDVVCLVMAPIVLDLVRRLRLPPVPYLIALATAANVGSVATLTGNPQNMLVGSFSGISYRAFLLREAPVAVIGLGLVFLVIWLVYRRQLPDTLPAANLQDRFAVHYPLIIKTLAAVSVMLVAFLAGVPIALVAIGGAAYTLLTRRVNPEKVYREIDWGLLVLFTGLFVVIGAVEEMGLAAEAI